MATLSTPVGAPSLGNYIFSGLQTRNYAGHPRRLRRPPAALALALDGLVRGVELGLAARRRRAARRCCASASWPSPRWAFAPHRGGDGRGAARRARSSSAPRPSPSSTSSPRSSPAPYQARDRRARRRDARVARLDGGLRRAAPRRDRRLRGLHGHALGDRHEARQGRARVAPRGAGRGARAGSLDEARRHARRRARLRERLRFACAREHAARLGLADARRPRAAAPASSSHRERLRVLRRAGVARCRGAYGLAFRERAEHGPLAAVPGGRGRRRWTSITAFSSDGRIAALGLVVLEDDRARDPAVRRVVLAGPRLARDAPDVLAALRPSTARSTPDAMRA